MKSIVAKWFLYSLGIGLIPIIILGASRGGIAVSPIILMLSILIGLIGSTVHMNIFAFTEGNKKQKNYSWDFRFYNFIDCNFVLI